MKALLPALVTVLLVFSASCTEKIKPGSVEVKRQVVTGVTLARLSPSEVDASYTTSGTLAAKSVSIISARTMGTIVAMKVREGDRVRQGQELAVLDDRDGEQRVASAEYGYREARKALEEADANRRLAGITYDRYKNLFNDNVITGQEMDQIETQKKVADLGYARAQEAVNRVRAQLEEVKINRGYSRIRAPHGGLITAKKAEQGSLAAPGSPLLVLEDTSGYRVEAAVDQGMASVVRAGTPVKVLLPPGRQEIPGKVSEVVPAVDPMTRSFVVKIDVRDGSSLRSGLYVTVSIPRGKKRALLVPKTAIVEKGQLTGVYAVDANGVMTYRMVRTGPVFGDRVELLSGLKDGETIAVAGLQHAIDGGIVEASAGKRKSNG